ncbi:hypothetical protein [Parvibacter caecicola]|uniref:hypothetical protein n=1 Tax=Parvibacter caecicola TaxID=747645 RepID=UPI00273060F2|nr:hypothetical protein [Parvibacter caecicola]
MPRPRYEDAEPVQFGDDIEIYDRFGRLDKGIIQSFHPNKGPVWMLSLVGCNHERLVRFDPETCVIKHPAPEVLGADGLPIVEGDVVYELGRDDALTVYEVNPQYIHAKKESGAAWNNLTAKYLTHTPPDTQERIDADADKYYGYYWGCTGVECERCPAMIDGKKPYERLGARSCESARILDLLRRQRELDARKGGAE